MQQTKQFLRKVELDARRCCGPTWSNHGPIHFRTLKLCGGAPPASKAENDSSCGGQNACARGDASPRIQSLLVAMPLFLVAMPGATRSILVHAAYYINPRQAFEAAADDPCSTINSKQFTHSNDPCSPSFLGLQRARCKYRLGEKLSKLNKLQTSQVCYEPNIEEHPEHMVVCILPAGKSRRPVSKKVL